MSLFILFSRESLQNDFQFRVLWLLYLWIKSKETTIGTDVEQNVYLLASLLLWLWDKSPKKIQGMSQGLSWICTLLLRAVDIFVLDDILHSLSLPFSSIPSDFINLPVKYISTLPFSDIFSDLEKAATTLENFVNSIHLSPNDYHPTLFLYDYDSIGVLSKFNSAPLYQLHAQKMKNGDSVFYSPVLSPVRNASLISPVQSTTLSIQTLHSNVPQQVWFLFTTSSFYPQFCFRST